MPLARDIVGRTLAALCCLAALRAEAGEFAITEVAPGIFVHVGHEVGLEDHLRGDSANIGFILGKNCAAVIDTGGSVATGKRLHEALRARTALPVCFVINTHVHFDHLLGNAAFLADHPSVVGHAELAAALAGSRAYFLEEFAPELAGVPAESAIVPPDRAVSDELRLDLGERELVLKANPTAHTNCDLTVYDAKTSTLWTGDLVFSGRLPVLDGSLQGWLHWMDENEARPYRHVVPGHGPAVIPWPDGAKPQHDYLAKLLVDVRAAIKAGRFLEQVVQAAEESPPAGWRLTEPHARNTSRAFREFEWQ